MRRLFRYLMTGIVSSMVVLGLPLAVNAQTITEGESFFFGSTEQDNKKDQEEAIEWIVLDVQGDKALLLSKKELDYCKFDKDNKSATWVSSTLRTWLNEEFFNEAFSEAERSAILTTYVSNDPSQGNNEWNVPLISDTEDRVFLLSYKEIVDYFEKKGDRKAKETAYSEAQRDIFNTVTSVVIKESGWWTRSPGKTPGEVCFIETDGSAKSKGVTEGSTVRPAIWIDLSADQSGFSYSMYEEAKKYRDQENYQEAAVLFETLGNYEKSAAEGIECRYLQAAKSVESGLYAPAIELYEAMGDYKDAYELCRDARYEYAVSQYNTGEYEKAAELFGKAGQYKDSMELMKECYDKLGVSVYYFPSNAVNTGLDNGYSKENEIKGDDRHFGWRLGRFFMSGFTRVTEEEAPIFIKTLGDSVTLWFDLEQKDIFRLNNNKNLSVSEDENGYDQYFGIKKTNFGRGTLIIRHTDYQNSAGDPVIYTDYLLAKGTTAADTKVILNEEGDYEVALDYQLQDDDLLHINKKYGNYKIVFKFSIRNGNCMVYPFDAVTGAELQNTAVTENGFYLDLARSRYLDIDVKRSVIIEGSSGMIEDERFNRPAKDGDQYTDEGIYTISVRNRYTGESTVKTLFVGSDELLQEYIKNGFSMDRLK